MRIHAMALACAGIFTALAIALPSKPTTDETQNKSSATLGHFPLELPSPATTALSSSVASKTPSKLDRWQQIKVRSGDTLYDVFDRLGVRKNDLYSLLASSAKAKDLTDLYPGQIFKIRSDNQGRLLELQHRTTPRESLRIVRAGDTFKALEYIHAIEKRTDFATGTIERSLYQAARQARLSERLIMQMVEIFGWDIDFALDIRPGDSFAVIYQEDYTAGERIGNGEILAAQFTNSDKTHRAVRYTNPDGLNAYYTPDGKAMRQAFLRTPVDFRRISSRFQASRWHPVLGKRRPHRGVDYAASTGTPVWATGDARVVFVGKKGGYGNAVILKHYGRYTTLYGHLSRFAKGLRNGSRVQQGQIIGYVGKTGLATGPHLHYEFRIDGVHQDPVTVDLPGQPPMERRYMADFRAKTSQVIAQLETIVRQDTQLAMSSQTGR